MKLNLILAVFFLSITCIFSQGINYKALIKDGGGNVVANQNITIQFQILQGGGLTNVYQETHTPTTDLNGIVIINIGEGSVDSGVFANIDWASDDHFLNVQIDTGSGLTDMGTTAFKTVPYALQAKAATTATTLPGGIDQGYIAALEARITALESVAIGDVREGGVVFWIDPADNTHGLVCAFSDYATLEEWGCNGGDLPNVPNVTNNPPSGSGAEIGDGINNTTNILNDCPTAPAAIAARSYGPEWFLPSAKELNEMYVNKSTLEAVPGFSAFNSVFFYWSSTEDDSVFAWGQLFTSGPQLSGSKFTTLNVRAVRAF